MASKDRIRGFGHGDGEYDSPAETADAKASYEAWVRQKRKLGRARLAANLAA